MTVQHDLFGAPTSDEWVDLVRPAEVSPELTRIARRLPQNLKLGTSSWSFSGWAGIVYADHYRQSTIARHGLAAYAQHPLLTGVGLDRTFYSPVSAEELAEYAAVVPDTFRFVAKAFTALTTDPHSARAARSDIAPAFLDAGLASKQVIAPLVEAFGVKLGAVLLQFSPLGAAFTRAPRSFIDRLGEFLTALPSTAKYAVELRDPEILGAEYEAMLRQTGATHCASVHPRMPAVDQQVTASLQGPLVVRWMLHPTQEYEAAAVRYAPFNHLVDSDSTNRGRIVKLIQEGIAAGRDVHVVAANKAEGSAPLTIFEIARAVATGRDVEAGSRPKP